jgi:hypothetical protein
LNRRQARWLDFFQEFAFEIVHIPGKKNVADYLSRIPGTETMPVTKNSTCGVLHISDLPCTNPSPQCNAVVSLFDESTLIDRIKQAQAATKVSWFLEKAR